MACAFRAILYASRLTSIMPRLASHIMASIANIARV